MGGPYCEFETIEFTLLLGEQVGGFQAPPYFN
jgi:hypothetical protein